MSDPHANSRTWWKSAIVYQIYPISFFDSNGDGLGDLNGIHSKLDYLKDLGVDVLWLSPIYKSPLADMGYDMDIDPRYGTLEDWDNLLKGVHERGMKLVMDLVVNHSSDEHAWFTESRSSKSSPKRNWYIWRPPKYDENGNRQPPNNWKSVFQGSAWDYDEATDEYYLHLYISKQPDLNWDNPDVRNAVYDMMKFWLDRGCDGFRMDVINLISKADGLPDAPIRVPDQPYQPASMYYANGPRVHQYVKEMRKEVLSKYDILTVGETPFTHDASQLAKYVLPENEELNMVFHFELMDIDSPQGRDISPLIHKPWTLDELREIEGRWQLFERERGFWNAIFIENHDHSRAVSRFGNTSTPFLQATSAKMIALLEIGQSGTQYIYQGQELGLKNFPRSWGVEEYKDVASINYWKLMLEKRRKETGEDNPDMTDVLDGFAKKARDHARVPMQWNSSPQAGFTTGTPWMRVNDDYKEWNAENQIGDPESVHSFYKKAVSVRKQNDVLIYGEYKDVSAGNKQVYAFTKTLGNANALILLNFGVEEAAFTVQDSVDMKFVLGNYTAVDEEGVKHGSEIRLKAYEGRLYIS